MQVEILIFVCMEYKNQERVKIIGKHIKLLRLRAGYTSYESFAQDHGLHPKSYWRVEAGYNFTINTLFGILDIHKMTIEDFFIDMKNSK